MGKVDRMIPDYEPTAVESSSTIHDHIYTTLLGVFGFVIILMIGVTVSAARRSTTTVDRASHLHFMIFLESVYLAVIIPVFVIRILYPTKRRWPTFGLNLVLLMNFPFGTILGAYGLASVDKKLRVKLQS